MFIDTHCHIHDRETYDFALSRQQVSQKTLEKNSSIPHSAEDFSPEKILARARKNDVEKIIVVGTSEEDSLLARNFASTHENTYWSWGVHPDEAEKYLREFIRTGGKARKKKKDDYDGPIDDPIAIGEVGLDYRNGKEYHAAQKQILKIMIMFAKMDDLPIIFHVRDAFDDFWPIVDEMGVERAVIHSFSDSEENMKKALDHGFYIGVNGLATFADLPTPPLEKTLLETDAPFLAPAPVRGRVNEPAYIPDIAKFLAEKHKKSVEEIAEITTKNAEKLFRI